MDVEGLILIMLSIVALAWLFISILGLKFNRFVQDQKSRESFISFLEELPHRTADKDLQETRHRIFIRVLQAFIVFIAIGAIVYLIPPLRALSISLLAGAGIAAIIIGFAVQKTFANMFAGIFIAINEPFHIGDYIKVEDKMGVVEDITLHHTVLREWRNRRYIIPNSVISEQLIENYTITHKHIKKTVEFGIAYDANLEKAKKIILDEINKHPLLMVPEEMVNGQQIRQIPEVRVTEWLDSGIQLRAHFWVADPFKGYQVKFDILEHVKIAFDKARIEIPYPYRTIVYKKDMSKPRRRKKK